MISKTKANAGSVRLNLTYHSINKMNIDDGDHNLLCVKLISGGPCEFFELFFDNYKGSTATKIKLEECRFTAAKYIFTQINTAINKSIQ
jgi:hypothetical protein